MAVGDAALLCAALLCAAVMGLAIQRGGTCTVAAVQDLLQGGRPLRLIAMVEASLWVALGLQVLQWAGGPVPGASGFALTGATLAGAVLLGLGAVCNRACVIGSIARLGSGEWAFAFTPLGFYAGCLATELTTGGFDPLPLAARPPALDAAPTARLAFATLAGAVVAWRIARLLRAPAGALAPREWSAGAATLVIGVGYLVLSSLQGPWAYTDVLADLARGAAPRLEERVLLAAALFCGAIAGGWSARRLHPVRPRLCVVARCSVGGALMGWGSQLLPGSNDGLVLLAMPLLWPYAWAAFVAMCLAIGGGLWGRRALARAP